MAGMTEERPGEVWHQIWTDVAILLGRRTVWQVFGVAVLLMAVGGPFGSYIVLDFPMRLAMWVVVGLAMLLAGVVSYYSIAAHLPERLSGGPGEAIVAGLAASLPVALVALVVDRAFVAVPMTGARLLTDWVNLAPFVLAMVWAISKTEVSAETRVLKVLAGPRAVPFLDRVKPAIGRDLISLSAQDHYIEVVTTGGRDLVLGRFADVVAQLADWDGFRIHRSHWVARKAVAEVERGAKPAVRLVDGRRLPVSRSYLSRLKSRDR
jgi:hypothetical protein